MDTETIEDTRRYALVRYIVHGTRYAYAVMDKIPPRGAVCLRSNEDEGRNALHELATRDALHWASALANARLNASNAATSWYVIEHGDDNYGTTDDISRVMFRPVLAHVYPDGTVTVHAALR